MQARYLTCSNVTCAALHVTVRNYRQRLTVSDILLLSQHESLNRDYTFVCSETCDVAPLQKSDDVWRLQTGLHAGGVAEHQYQRYQRQTLK